MVKGLGFFFNGLMESVLLRVSAKRLLSATCEDVVFFFS